LLIKRYQGGAVLAKPLIGIQLYSLRDQTEIDFLGTLEKAAEIGYQTVEFAGYYKTPAIEVKKKLAELKLAPSSAHVPLNFENTKRLESDLAGQIDYAKEIGIAYIVTPWVPLPVQPTMDDVLHLTEVLTKCGQMVKDAGMQYSYHNHEFDFKLVEDKPVINHILEQVPAELLVAEFDLGWIYLAGYNPLEYLARYQGRSPLVHFKDFADGRKDVEVGKGQLGYDELLDKLEPLGVTHIYVEQEQFPENSLVSAKNNFEFFKQRGYGLPQS
jgi:sugar phosphate isomerase/epimerase